MKLKLPPGSFQDYLFDCDGTIADSMPLHYVVWRKALSGWGCEFSEEIFFAWGGMPVAEIIATLNRSHGLNMPVERVSRRKEELYFEGLPKLKAVPEVLEHIEASRGQIPFCCRLRKHPRFGDRVAKDVKDSRPLLNALVCAGDYQKSKPDPQPFLITAEMLGAPSAHCLVFEDTDMGIQAAHPAGMAPVRFPQPWKKSGKITTAHT